jgi:uncharacterized repeat protein (TIGR03803 family)
MRKINGRFGAVARITASMGMMLAAAIASPAQTFKTLANFTGNNGADPFYMSLVQGTDGDLYGTTAGTFIAGGSGYGTVFKMTPAGTLTTLHTFHHSDGADPAAGLVLGTDENFYGTTLYGGANGSCQFGCGTIFRITSDGVLTTLHSFDGTDGAYPSGRLLQATDGNFYGTTQLGGANCRSAGGSGCGTIFKLTPAAVFTTLHSFDGSDGSTPVAALVQGKDDRLYGTTYTGGTGSCLEGCGTVFEISRGGTLTTLHYFGGFPGDGAKPEAALFEGSNGNFYGTTFQGGAYDGPYNQPCQTGAGDEGCGTIFKINPTGTLTTLYNFCPQDECGDGAWPISALVRGTDGNLYGTTDVGGNDSCGTVFKISPQERLTTLHSFDFTDGCDPYAGLMQDTSGRFYGTSGGGASGDGTVFSLSTGLGPFVTTLPTSRAVGQRVAILGNSLTRATSVTLNGTPATFTVVSATEIEATVPTGATTGPVQVVTPSGTLTSNANFRVEP